MSGKYQDSAAAIDLLVRSVRSGNRGDLAVATLARALIVNAATREVITGADLKTALDALADVETQLEGSTEFGRSLWDDADAAAALTTLGVSAFVQTLLNDADASTARATLGIPGVLNGLGVIDTLTSNDTFDIPYLLGKIGANGPGFAEVAGSSDLPQWVIQSTALEDDPISSAAILGIAPFPLNMQCADEIPAGIRVAVAPGGLIDPLPSAPGTYTVVGISLDYGAGAGFTIPVAHCVPYRVTVSL